MQISLKQFPVGILITTLFATLSIGGCEPRGQTLKSMVVTPSPLVLSIGDSQQFYAAGKFDNNLVSEVTQELDWKSSDETVVKFTPDAGAVGKVIGLKVGSAVVTATDPETGVTATVDVTVNEARLKSAEIKPANAVLPASWDLTYTVSGTFSDGTVRDVTSRMTLSSSDESIANFPDAPQAHGITGGAVTITATDTLGTGITATTALTVSPAFLVKIVVTDQTCWYDDKKLPQGISMGFIATGVMSDGTKADLTSQVVWSSSNTDALYISNAPGSVGQGKVANDPQFDGQVITITATQPGDGGMSATLPLTFLPVDPSYLKIEVANPAGAQTDLSTPLGVPALLRGTLEWTNCTKQDLTADPALVWSIVLEESTSQALAQASTIDATGLLTTPNSSFGYSPDFSLKIRAAYHLPDGAIVFATQAIAISSPDAP